MNDLFSGTPFVVGSIRGERCWQVDSTGKLISPSQRFMWVNGENTSYCMKSVYSSDLLRYVEETLFPGKVVSQIEIKTKQVFVIHQPHDTTVQMVHPHWQLSTYNSEPDEYCIVTWREKYPVKVGILSDPFPLSTEKTEIPEILPVEYVEMHNETKSWISMGQLNQLLENVKCNYARCGCGFYAYLNGYNEYLHQSQVVGIIEGYGETHIGTRGFRARKAKILALAPVVKFLEVPDVNWNETFFSFDPANLSNGGFQRFGVTHENGGKTQIVYNQDMISHRGVTFWRHLKENYPDTVFFSDPDIMRAEFPPTNLDEVL